MFIEQAYKGNTSLFRYLLIPVGFMGFMALNYVALITSEADTKELMTQMIDQLGANTVLVINLLPLVLGFFFMLFWYKFILNLPLKSAISSRSRVDYRRIFFSFLLWGSVIGGLTFIEIFNTPENYVWNFDKQKFMTFALIALLLIPLQTSFEELLFRGHMIQGIGIHTKNRAAALIITSVLFGLMHIANPEVGELGYGILAYYIGTGFLFGIITLMDEGLELVLGFHAANNLIGALLVSAEWTAFRVDSLYIDISKPELNFTMWIPLLVIYPLILLILAKKYKWSDWNYRLFGKVKNTLE
ncbi:MAG: CPBP family intramembrane metalloprotease domain-containing protein [Flavobacteriaceae bacterium]|nr:CPBP family intramembrane metalloprotease domain-containing protein [Flavobacteriaceae bacterium]OUX39129.1 MAG: CPBP family intramembrane metalloprotease domain-containing protein [Flavobacteriaceae bacterium TMED265]